MMATSCGYRDATIATQRSVAMPQERIQRALDYLSADNAVLHRNRMVKRRLENALREYYRGGEQYKNGTLRKINNILTLAEHAPTTMENLNNF